MSFDPTMTMALRAVHRIHVHYSNGEQEYLELQVGRSEYVIGRVSRGASLTTQIQLKDDHISRQHCRIYWDDRQGWMVADLDSVNGSELDGQALLEPRRLPFGSALRLGTTQLTVEMGADAASVAAAASAAARDEDEDRTMVAPGNEDSTRLLPPEEEATALIGGAGQEGADDEETALMAPVPPAAGDEEATALMAPGSEPTEFSPADGGESTKLLPAEGAASAGADETAVVAVAGGAGGGGGEEPPPRTLDEPDDEERGRRLPAVGAASVGSDETAVVAAAGGAGGGGGDEPPPPQDEPADEIGEGEAGDAEGGVGVPEEVARGVEVPVYGIAAELVAKGLLEAQQAATFMNRARESGKTFFRVLGESRSVRYLEQIYGYVAEQLGIELIKEESVVMVQAISTRWLSFQGGGAVGAVVLAGGAGEEIQRVGVFDPYDLPLRDWISRQTDDLYEIVLINPDALFPALRRLRKAERFEEGEGDIGLAVIRITPSEERRMRANLDQLEPPQMVDYFIHRAHQQKASDIHIEPTEETLTVRNRVDGILHEEVSLPTGFHSEVVSRIKIMSGMDVAEKRRPQDGRFGVLIHGSPIDVRVSSYPTVFGEKIVFRLLDQNALRPSPESLGLLPRDLRLLKDKINAPFGLIMISGPTGSGKTTTLYSCLGSIDRKSRNILTVEDPVEYRLDGVYQMQVNEKIGLSFASGLRTILRQDPDVVMVGECRDRETAAMAIQASLTGHIVFSTIHTNDAVGVVSRLLDMGIEPFLVSTALSMAIAQRLVRTICPHCRDAVTGEKVLEKLAEDGISSERLEQLGIEVDPQMAYAQGRGCAHCRNTGYQGRRAVFEIFEMTNEARNVIINRDIDSDTLRELARRNGMTTLITHGLKLVEDEETTFEEVIRVLGEVV